MQRIGFIVLPGFQMLSVTALSVFELANWEIGEPVYDVHLLSETGGSIRSSIGIGCLMLAATNVPRARCRSMRPSWRRACSAF